MVARTWEELPIDCLVEVLGRVEMESLIFDVPLVCKSWYKATLSTFCWKQLHFPDFFCNLWSRDYFIVPFFCEYQPLGGISTTKFLKVVVDRSAGCATMVKLPGCYTVEALTYVADKCPALKKLVLHSPESASMLAQSSAIRKLKILESLEFKGTDYLFQKIVTEIGAHCENFVALSLVRNEGVSDTYIGYEETMAIVSCLPKIKCLGLRYVWIEEENLIKILKGCVDLVHLDVRDCFGFSELNTKILELASHIPAFYCSGSYIETLVMMMNQLCLR